jgi:hypothetical protein
MTEKGTMWLLHETYGFKVLPPPSDYVGYGKSLLVCANGDGIITAAERAWVLGYLDAYGAPPAVIEQLSSYQGNDPIEQILEHSPTVKMSAVGALYNAIRACASDGVLSLGERSALDKMAGLVGVDSGTVHNLIELHYEEEHLRGKRLRLLFAQGIPFQG